MGHLWFLCKTNQWFPFSQMIKCTGYGTTGIQFQPTHVHNFNVKFQKIFYGKPRAPHTGRLYSILPRNPLQHPGLCLGLNMSIIYTVVTATDDTSYKTCKIRRTLVSIEFGQWIMFFLHVIPVIAELAQSLLQHYKHKQQTNQRTAVY